VLALFVLLALLASFSMTPESIQRLRKVTKIYQRLPKAGLMINTETYRKLKCCFTKAAESKQQAPNLR